MKITQILKNKPKNKLTVSVEITPPVRGHSIDDLFKSIESIMPFSPLWIDVTSHAAGVSWVPTESSPNSYFEKRIHRKMPGTIAICGAIQQKFALPTVPHLLCHGFTREETEDALIDLSYLGVENILALRGDATDKEKQTNRTYNHYASDLVEQIHSMNQGKYLAGQGHPTQFEIGVACYPEKQFEAPNLAWDIKNFAKKEKAGASYAVTQMFFDNRPYLDFLKTASKEVKMPIIPATKILCLKKHITSVPKFFHIDLPTKLAKDLEDAKTDKEALEAGVNWAHKQSQGLIEAGHHHLHFYVMKNTKPFRMLMERLL